MVDEQLEEAKAALRVQARARRASITSTTAAEAASAAMRYFLEGIELTSTQIVSLYWPVRDEFDCRPLLIRLVDSGQPVCLPETNGDEPLTMRLWAPDQPLYPSGFGTLAPIETAPVVEPDVVVAPLLAFDGKGNRLGYGKGHYDRTMARMRKQPRFIGLAFSAQELPSIPREPHDRRLDSIVTELGIRHFSTTDSA
jgi:5-formyltetrahydrofolate cyclo-ligase